MSTMFIMYVRICWMLLCSHLEIYAILVCKIHIHCSTHHRECLGSHKGILTSFTNHIELYQLDDPFQPFLSVLLIACQNEWIAFIIVVDPFGQLGYTKEDEVKKIFGKKYTFFRCSPSHCTFGPSACSRIVLIGPSFVFFLLFLQCLCDVPSPFCAFFSFLLPLCSFFLAPPKASFFRFMSCFFRSILSCSLFSSSTRLPMYSSAIV